MSQSELKESSCQLVSVDHGYAKVDLMDTDSHGDKRSREDTCGLMPSTPSKGAHTRKVIKPNQDEVTNSAIRTAINTLAARFDTQEKNWRISACN